jgi:hypothetical protein
MTITFENESDVIVYAFEKVISYARRNQQIFVAQCIWWLASIIGLKQGLVNHIDNLRARERLEPITYPDKTQQIRSEKAVSSTPRNLQEDLRLDRILEKAVSSTPRDLQEDLRLDRILGKAGKKANKIKRLQEGKRKQEVKRNRRQRKNELRSSETLARNRINGSTRLYD